MANLANPSEYRRQVFAQDGFRVVTSASSPVAGESYAAIYVVADAVVTATAVNGDSLSSLSLSAGAVIYGNFSAVSVASGTVIAYIL